jgi:hypothetical protein
MRPYWSTVRLLALAALVPAVAAACMGGSAATALGADRVVATNVGLNLDAFHGTFSWIEERCLQGPCDFRLALFSGGVRRFPPLPRFEFTHPHLGAGRDGSILAAYSRCRAGTLGCDAFVFGLRSGRERRLRSLSTRRWSEYEVAAWRGRYLFARLDGGVFVTRPLRRLSALRHSSRSTCAVAWASSASHAAIASDKPIPLMCSSAWCTCPGAGRVASA